jgi:type I restriction enzyme S subunit
MAGRAGSPSDRGWLFHPEYPRHWRRCSLYSMARWVNGLAFRNIHFSVTGMPVVKIAEIKDGISGQTKFTQQTFDDSVRVRPGDLLFSWSGQPETSIDAFWWRGPEGWLNQHVFRVTPAEGIDPTFFYYLLRYLKPNFVAIARNKQTTGLGHVTKRDLEDIEGAYPELAEQRAIAHILGTLDDKIELNRRMSETLEAMARALFKAWFVDFEPVRAKMEGRWRRGQSLPGLPAHLYDLFPDRLVDSELGEIPEGWEVVRLGELIETVKGRSYKSEELVEGSEVALVTLKSFARGGGYRPDGLKPFAGPYKQEQVVKPGEVVVACTDVTQAAEVIGRAAMVRRSNLYRELVASLDTLVVRPKTSDMTVASLYSLLRTDAFIEHTYAHVTGTTVLHLAKDAVPSFAFALPPERLIHVFDGIATRTFSKVETLELESDTLTALRDALLPKLVRGEIRVRDVERFLKVRGL